MTDCIFCKIIANDIPSYKLYENANVLAILDIFPVHPGHALVMPKKHTQDIFDTDEETMKHIISAAKHIAPAVISAVHAEGVNISLNSKKAAGQDVFHVHMHVIPRYENDGLKTWQKESFRDDKQKEEIANEIKRNLK